MEPVYQDLIDSFQYLKKGKQNTRFAAILGQGKNPPWIIIGKASEVQRKAKGGRIKAVSGYKPAIISARVERVGRSLYLIVENNPSELAPILTKLARLTDASKEAQQSSDKDIKKGAGYIKKLAVLLKNADTVTEAEFKDILKTGTAPTRARPALEGEGQLLDAGEREEDILSEEDLAAIFDQDAPEVIASVRASSQLLENIEDEGMDQSEKTFELLSFVLQSDDPETIAEGLIKTLLNKPVISSNPKGVGDVLDIRVLGGMFLDTVSQCQAAQFTINENLAVIEGETNKLIELKRSAEADNAPAMAQIVFLEAASVSTEIVQPLYKENQVQREILEHGMELMENLMNKVG